MRILFLGTAAFAVPPLESLVSAGVPPVLVITQPAARRGRGRQQTSGPVARAAISHGLALVQPLDVNQPDLVERVRRVGPDLAIVVAYGQKLGPEILDLPRLGTFNLHASLLPRYRGAAPIQKAILEGEQETGVTLLEVVERMDAGDIVAQCRTEITTRETAGELHNRLARLGAELLVGQLEALASGHPPLRSQDPGQVTWACKLTKDDGRVRFDRPAPRLVDHVRAMTPWPGAFCFAPAVTGKPPVRLILLESRAIDLCGGSRPGAIVEAGERLVVACREQALEILKLKREGKRAMESRAFLRGFPLRQGDDLT